MEKDTEAHLASSGYRFAPVFGSGVVINECMGEWDCHCDAIWVFKECTKALYKYSAFTT